MSNLYETKEMDKMIERLLRQLKYELWLAVLAVVAVVVMGELNVIPNGIVEPKSQTEFVLTLVAVVMMVVGIPLAIKLFTLNTTKGLRRMNMDEALLSYHHWSIARLAILVLAEVCSLVVYYITLNDSPVFCALALQAVVIYCIPTRVKLKKYIDQLKVGSIN